MGGDTVAEAVAALCAPDARVGTSRRAEAPRSPGIYAWWSRSPTLLGITGTQHGDSYLYYVGITAAQRGLKGRLRQHVQGPLKGSTLRRALVALGATGARPSRTTAGELALTKDEELALTEWIASTLETSWHATATPGVIEADVIAQLRPPLNIQQNRAHESWVTVSGARRAMASPTSQKIGT